MTRTEAQTRKELNGVWWP